MEGNNEGRREGRKEEEKEGNKAGEKERRKEGLNEKRRTMREQKRGKRKEDEEENVEEEDDEDESVPTINIMPSAMSSRKGMPSMSSRSWPACVPTWSPSLGGVQAKYEIQYPRAPIVLCEFSQ